MGSQSAAGIRNLMTQWGQNLNRAHCFQKRHPKAYGEQLICIQPVSILFNLLSILLALIIIGVQEHLQLVKESIQLLPPFGILGVVGLCGHVPLNFLNLVQRQLHPYPCALHHRTLGNPLVEGLLYCDR